MEAENVVVLDPNCMENALLGFTEVTSATVSHCSSGYEESEGAGVLLAGPCRWSPGHTHFVVASHARHYSC